MQATVTTKTRRFGFDKFGATMLALGIAVGVAFGALGAAAIDNLPTLRTSEQAIVLPKAYSHANQGEGMLAGSSAVAAVRASTSDQQGEGIVGGNMAVAAPRITYTSLGRGEGILGGHSSRAVLTTPITVHGSAGSGEGWVANGRPATTLRAHSEDGQGEGWISNGRP
jgi:hypothetical protein